MNHKMAITYFDQADSTVKIEYPFASGFLYWSYNTAIGRTLTTLILSRGFISRLYGWLARTRLSRCFIAAFIKATYKNNMDHVVPKKRYSCLNDYFIREPEKGERSLNQDTNSLIAPVDGKLLAYENIIADDTFLVKRNIFNLNQLLRDKNLAHKYSGGTMLILRLCLSDYHQFYFPDSGMPDQYYEIRGKYYAGGSYGFKRPTPFYTENYRTITIFNSDNFGKMAMVEIGAFTVGSIKQTYIHKQGVKKGDKKGYFELGGSTVVLLLKKNKIKMDKNLILRSLKGIETKVSFGEQIAVKREEQSAKEMAVL